MVQLNFGPYLDTEIKQKQGQVRKDYRQVRVANPMVNMNLPSDDTAAKVLFQIGKKLVSFGTLLEHRYSHPLVETQHQEHQKCDGNS